MINNTTRAKLAAGETVVGTFFKYAEGTLAENVALTGVDFMVFDGEHGNVNAHQTQDLCRAAELHGVTPISRVPTNQPHDILQFLDAGAHGVHVPWVNSVEGVEEAVQSVKYGPRGRRGLAGSRASRFGFGESIAEYTVRANRETMVIIHIETIDAVNLVEQYVDVPDVDVLFIGPTDLSHSLGHPGQFDHPEVAAAMDRVAEVVVPSDKVLGIYAGSSDFATAWKQRGARYFTTGIEGFMSRGLGEYVERVKG
ncbi:MAG: 2,4-dihydroxyhept-2-ene-1,7-dioic acid aldolase [Acidimicrobiia bacterium]|nr:2,4-dihydroxyhept-2-ene-1,7-dioic acid aldolase [Acidimicrobiia bacterium]